MKPNHSYLCTKECAHDGFTFKEEEFYDTDVNGDLVDDVEISHHISENLEENFLDEDEVQYCLTPKGCLSWEFHWRVGNLIFVSLFLSQE